MFEHTSEPLLAPHLAQRFGLFEQALLFAAFWDRHVAQALMGTDRVEIGNILPDDVIKVIQADADKVIEALALERADPVFREAIRDRTQDRCQDYPALDAFAALAFEGFVKRFSELAIVVMDQEAWIGLGVVKGYRAS